MSIKKKLGLGVASAALGLSLIGGGTWAAFNDVETMDNRLAAGTLDLRIGNQAEGVMKVSNLKPGDTMTRQFKLQNWGSLDIEDVLLTVNPVGETAPGFLGEFAVTILNTDGINLLSGITGSGVRDGGGTYVSMQDLINHSNAGGFDISSVNLYKNPTIPGRDEDIIDIKVEFVDKSAKDAAGKYVQNQYQGKVAEFRFVFEATQSAGSERANN
ncbi:TasA family protein [Bacillus sp. JJ1532]|uniref:TasA family protein n=1 Tax=unclassified Bacillus (in: firmicutes) TaxID=185979 RepID=UPI002FFF072B